MKKMGERDDVSQYLTLAIMCGGKSSRFGTDKGLYAPDGGSTVASSAVDIGINKIKDDAVSTSEGVSLSEGGHRKQSHKGAELPLFLRAVELLEADFAKVIIVVRDDEQRNLYRQELKRNASQFLEVNIEIIIDKNDAGGASAPLVAVYSALDAVDTSHLMILPVDQVGVRRTHLRHLAEALFRNLNSGMRDDSVISYGNSSNRSGSGGSFRASQSRSAHYIHQREDHDLPFPSIWPKSKLEQVHARIQAKAFSVMGALRDIDAVEVLAGSYEEELCINANHLKELCDYLGTPIRDPFGRRVNYLRFSLTEVCNLSCQYCLPDGSPQWLKQRARISLDKIESVLRGFRSLGFRKVRLTGGEPTVHNKCLETIELARKIGFEEICMTTNGLLIDDMKKWVDAGLTQLNFSLDTLDDDVFLKITKSRGADKVLRNVDAAIAEGIKVKINAVLMRSINFHEAERLIRWGVSRNLTMRFIELMPMELNQKFDEDERILNTALVPVMLGLGLAPVGQECARPTDGPEKIWAGAGLPGKIGFISPLSCNFCKACNRLRMTSRGALKLCLFGSKDIQIDMSSPESVARDVMAALPAKPERHGLEKRDWGNVSTLRTIGG